MTPTIQQRVFAALRQRALTPSELADELDLPIRPVTSALSHLRAKGIVAPPAHRGSSYPPPAELAPGAMMPRGLGAVTPSSLRNLRCGDAATLRASHAAWRARGGGKKNPHRKRDPLAAWALKGLLR